MNKEEQTRLQEELDKIVSAIETQEGLRGNMPADVLDGIIAGLMAQKEGLEGRIAALSGSGAIAIGDHVTAVGERGIGIKGDISRHTEQARLANAQFGGIQSDEIRGRNVVAGAQYNIQNAHFSSKKESDSSLTLRESYLNRLIYLTGILPLESIDKALAEDAECRLSLGAVYIALLTLGSETDEPAESAKRIEKARRASALAHLNRHPHMVLLGDPGSGKSTFVNFVALCLAGESLGDPCINIELLTQPLPKDESENRFSNEKDKEPKPQPWDHGPLLPVRVILRDFAARGLSDRKAGASDLWNFITAELETAQLGDFVPEMEKELRKKGGVILLDGLDEVPEAENRRVRIKQVVQDFMAGFPKCRVLVTSRTYAYQKQEWRISGLAEAVLAPFSKGQIEGFIERWYTHVAGLRGWPPEDAKGKAELLKRAVFTSNRLRDLAERPLILTLMASLHAWHGGSLPEKREELYADAVDLLLDRWESKKIIRDPQGKILLQEPSLAEFLKTDKTAIRELLNQLAYEAHAAQTDLQGTADISEKDLVFGLINLSSGDKTPDAKELIRFLHYRAGLLIPRGVGVYTFPHRTFQEYLAACHLTDLDFPDQVAELARTDPDRWREVALLAGAKAAGGASANIWSLAEACCYRPPDHSDAGQPDYWGALLAGQALVETAKLDKVSPRNEAKLENIRQWQVKLLEGDQLPAFERALAGRNLAIMGDPRKSVTTLAHMEFCLIPAGPFHMGSEKDDREKPYHLNESLSHYFWMARHPITNRQFDEFVKVGGYTERRFWTIAEEAGYWKQSGFKGFLDDEFRTRPHEYGAPFNFANHPVVGITWYEALAFTRWLTEVWQQTGVISEKWQIRLPSEAEWEKAARGGLEIPEKPLIGSACENLLDQQTAGKNNPVPERIYPSGNQLDKNTANFRETGIGSTSALGCFSAGMSPYGCMDMAGNVWEWTLSAFDDYPYVPGDGREELKGDKSRVLRGGAFNRYSDYLRCAYRLRCSPYLRVDDFGFRCVCAPN